MYIRSVQQSGGAEQPQLKKMQSVEYVNFTDMELTFEIREVCHAHVDWLRWLCECVRACICVCVCVCVNVCV